MSPYDYDRTARSKVADEWSSGVRKFTSDFEKLVVKHHEQMMRGMVGDVAKLVKQFADSLTGYEFQKGNTPESVAKRLVVEVLAPEEGSLYNEWALENFFRQGYFGLEREEIDMTGAVVVIRKAIEDFTRKERMPLRSLDVKPAIYKDRLVAELEWADPDKVMEGSFAWVDDLEKALVGPLSHWSQSKGIGRFDMSSIETLPVAKGVRITFFF